MMGNGSGAQHWSHGGRVDQLPLTSATHLSERLKITSRFAQCESVTRPSAREGTPLQGGMLFFGVALLSEYGATL